MKQSTWAPIGTGLLLFFLSALLFLVGIGWMFPSGGLISISDFGTNTAAIALIAILFGFGALFEFALGRLYPLMRGWGRSMLIMGVFVALTTVFQQIDTEGNYRPILIGLILIILTIYLGYTNDQYRLHDRGSTAWLIAFTLFVGLLITIAFPFFGALGSWEQITEAVFEALVLGSTLSVAVWTIFAFDQPLLNARPVGSRLIALWMWIAYTPIILGGRGSEIQGLAGALLLIVAAFIAGRLLVWPKMLDRTPRLTPLVIFAVTILAVFLLSFEDHELDFMPDELILSVMAAWLAALVGVALIRLVWTVTRFQPAAGGMGLWIAALLLGALAIFGYERAEGPIVQPRALFVVMADQSNTAPLSQLADRDVRVAAVYEQLTQHANETQSDVRGWLDGREVTYTPFYLVNGLEVEGNLFLRWQLIFREDVAYVIESPRNRPVRAISFGAEEVELDPDELLGSMSDPPAEVTWGIDAIQADRVWTELGVRGEGVVVGIADSGSDWTHPNLGPAYRGIDGGEHDYNWFDPELGTTEPTDSGSHGTHVAGTVVGQNNTGVAPGAQWIACRNLPRNLGNPADYIACMEFLFAPFPLGGDPFTEGDPLRGAHLTNNSWGCPPIEGCDGRTVGIGVNHLRNAGQLMVVAAGNAGPSCQTSDVPAMGDAAFSVGAIESDITVAAFSSRGPGIDINGELIVKPDIMAPGVDVISSIPGNRYAAFPGTSMASPHVAGVVALLWSANPALIGDIEATEEILRSTTQEIDISITSTNQCGPPTEPMTGNVIGAGLINAYAAVEQALQGR